MRLEIIQSMGKEVLRQKKEVIEFTADDGVENEVINLYPDVTFQEFEGFGGAITDASGFVFSQMSREQQDKMLSFYFKEEQMNYQNIRIPIDSGGFSTHSYSAVEEPEDETLESFSFADTKKYILPLLEAASKTAGRPLKLMLSPWSPPAFMKTNGSRRKGGSLKKEYYGRWAAYICRYIQEFQKRGYQVERISIQNEPKAVQEWESCVYSAQQEKTFLKEYLYPALKEKGLSSVEVFVWDHNKERVYERFCKLMDKDTAPMIAGAAFHWYSGDHFETLELIRRAFPEKKLILSESSLEYAGVSPSRERDYALCLAHDLIGNLNHGLQGFYDGNILLNIHGGPNSARHYCDAAFLYNEESKELLQRRSAFFFWHFAHFIQPKAVRIAHSKYTDKLEVTAWKNPAGEIAVILLNKTGKRVPFVLRINGKVLSCYLHPFAIASGVIL